MLWNQFRLHECKICPLLTFGVKRKRTSRKHAARGPKARCQRRGGAARAGPPALSPSRRYRATRTCAQRRSVSNCRGLVGSSLASVDHLVWSACRAGMCEHRARRHTCTAHNPVCRRLLVRRGQRSEHDAQIVGPLHYILQDREPRVRRAFLPAPNLGGLDRQCPLSRGHSTTIPGPIPKSMPPE